MKECNVCAVHHCAIAKQFRRIRKEGMTKPTALELQQKCSYYIPLPPLTTNLFEYSIFRNPQGMYKALKLAKMRIVDQRKSPYFKIVSEFSRKKKRRERKKK